ncbi:MAG: MotA/TolQ/ExbB proton channel family protein [Anderseniella sp.]
MFESLASLTPSGALQSLTHIMSLGGPVVLILAVLSVLALAVTGLKVWQLFRIGRSDDRRIHRALSAWRNGNRAKALASLKSQKGPAPAILARMIPAVDAVPVEAVREDVERIAGRQLAEMRSGLRVLDAIAQVAPLLGLFGTVLGMIEAFRQLQAAGSQVDPSMLAGGIWIALLTTAVGLGVAMPVSLVLSAFEARIAREQAVMEDVFTAAFTGAPVEGGASTEQPQISVPAGAKVNYASA